MIRAVKNVDPALLIEAYKVVSDNRDTGDDHVVILVSHSHKRLDSDTLLSIDYRLMALANVVKKDDPSPWVIASKNKEYKLISEALLRAAASAPLRIDDKKLIGEVAFETDSFTKHALAESDIEGRA